MIISMLDEVAWLFNLRGSDIDYNPVFFAYAVVTPDSATLYIDAKKLTEDVKAHLGGDVKIAPYEDIFRHSRGLGEGINADSVGGKIFCSNKTSWALTLSLGENKVTEGTSYIHTYGPLCGCIVSFFGGWCVLGYRGLICFRTVAGTSCEGC